MRLLKKITYERFLELPEHKNFIEIFEKKLPGKNNVNVLNFYLVIEYENAFDSANYDDMFPENSVFVDFQSMKKEHSNIISRIKKQMDNNKVPVFLKKLGVTNILKGCYLVGHTSHDLPKNIKTSSKKNISIKFDFNSIPKEIIDLCEEYYNKNIFSILKEKEDFDVFFKLTKKEQDKEIAILFQQFSNYTNKNMLFSMANTGVVNTSGQTNYGLTVEELFEKNIDFFTDVPFLEQVFESAKEDENYELCGKIKKRLDFIREAKKM